MSFLPRVSEEKLFNVAKLTGGAAMLIWVAFFVSGSQPAAPAANTAIAVCSDSSTPPCASGGTTLNFSAASDTVNSGDPALLTWSTGGNAVVDLPNSISCFGRGTTCDTATTLISSISQVVSFNNAPVVQDAFTAGGRSYVVVGEYSGSSNLYRVYRWNPNATLNGKTGCYGTSSDTNCTTSDDNAYQQLNFDNHVNALKVVTVGSDVYLIGAVIDGNGVNIFKWMPNGGTSCPNGGAGPGFGNGTTCGSIYQSIATSNGLALDTYYDSTTNTTYLVVAYNSSPSVVRLYKWMASGASCPTGGGFGSGTTCGSRIGSTDLLYPPLPTDGGSSHRYSAVEKLFSVGGQMYLVSGNGQGYRLYKWISSSSCFGSDSAHCGSSLQGLYVRTGGLSSGYTYSQPSDATIFTDDGDTYLVAGFDFGTRLYAFAPGCFSGAGGWGSSTTTTSCASDGSIFKQTIDSTANSGVSSLLVGQNRYLALGITATSPALPIAVDLWMSDSACFGDGTVCGHVWKSYPSASNAGKVLLSTASGNVLLTALPGSRLQAFQSIALPCFGDGSSGCGVAQNSIPSANYTAGWGVFSSNGSTYVTRADASSYSYLYQWNASSNCLGDASGTCGSYVQKIGSSNAADMRPLSLTSGTSNTAVVVSNDSGSTGARLYNLIAARTNDPGDLGTSGGFMGQYFNNQNLAGVPTLVRGPEPVNFDWGSGAPDSSLGNDNFSVRWTGTVVIPSAGSYTFYTTSDDGVAVWFDDTLVINDWSDHSAHTSSYTATFAAGQKIRVRIDYYDNNGSASIKFQWKPPGQGSAQDIPTSVLYPYQLTTTVAGGGPCLGNERVHACGVPLQSLAPDGIVISDATTTSSGTFLGLGLDSGNARIYRWMSSANGGYGCFGDGTTCTTEFADLFDNNTRAVEFFNIGTALYVGVGRSDSGSGAKIYKYMTSGTGCPSGGGFGNGSACNTALQTSGPNYTTEMQFFRINNTDYWAFTGDSARSIYLEKWTSSGTDCPTGGEFGDGSVCNAGIIKWGSKNNESILGLTYLPYGSDGYLVVSRSAAAGGLSIYKYMAACNSNKGGFGDGNTCGAELQTISTPSDVYDAQAFLLGGTPYLFGGTYSAGTFTYQFMPNAGVTPGCSVSDGTSVIANDNAASGFQTDPLTQDTTYTLSCNGVPVTSSITVNVAQGKPTATASAPDATAAENASPADTGTLRVSLDAAQTSDTTVYYTIATGGANAINGTDYQTIASSVVVPAGQTSADITVTPLDDLIYEGPETVTLTLATDDSYDIGSPSSATVTINDDESGTSLPAATFDACLTANSTCEIGVNPLRVRQGNTALVTWNVSGLITGANGHASGSCTITTSPALSPAFSQSWPQTGTTWVNSTGVAATIQQQTVFTLRCTSPDGTVSKSKTQTVQLIPSIQEI